MNEQKDGSRKYDAANPRGLAEFMKTGWAPTPLEGIVPSEAIPFVILIIASAHIRHSLISRG